MSVYKTQINHGHTIYSIEFDDESKEFSVERFHKKEKPVPDSEPEKPKRKKSGIIWDFEDDSGD